MQDQKSVLWAAEMSKPLRSAATTVARARVDESMVNFMVGVESIGLGGWAQARYWRRIVNSLYTFLCHVLIYSYTKKH